MYIMILQYIQGHLKILNFGRLRAKIPNSRGMGHCPKMVKISPEFSKLSPDKLDIKRSEPGIPFISLPIGSLRRHWVVPWARHINPSLVLVQPRKTRPYITESLLMGCKESNQTKKHWFRIAY